MLFILHPATMRNFLHHLVFAVEPRIRSKRPAARAAWLCRRFRKSGDLLDHHFFLCLIQRGSADTSRQPAVRGLDGLAARKAEVIHPYLSRRSTHSCSLGKGPCSKNPPSSNASVINRIAGADSACRTICFPFKIEIFRNVFLSFLSQIKKIFAFFFSFPHLLKLQSCYIKISPKE